MVTTSVDKVNLLSTVSLRLDDTLIHLQELCYGLVAMATQTVSCKASESLLFVRIQKMYYCSMIYKRCLLKILYFNDLENMYTEFKID